MEKTEPGVSMFVYFVGEIVVHMIPTAAHRTKARNQGHMNPLAVKRDRRISPKINEMTCFVVY